MIMVKYDIIHKGMSSIHYSCVNKNYELSLLLLKNEADCDSINCIG